MKQKSRGPFSRQKTEHHFAELIAKKTKLYLAHTPDTYHIRYALIDRISGDISAWLETVSRSGSPLPEFPLSLSIWMNGIELVQETGKPFIIGYQWDQRNFLLQIQGDHLPMVLVEKMASTTGSPDYYAGSNLQDHSLPPDSHIAQHTSRKNYPGDYVVRIPGKLFYAQSDI